LCVGVAERVSHRRDARRVFHRRCPVHMLHRAENQGGSLSR
jgi:hypothetical protein